MLEYEWSGVIPIYQDIKDDIEIITAEIDTEHMKTAMKGARGRPLTNWDFIFSPEKFDQEISLDQFCGHSLPLEEM